MISVPGSLATYAIKINDSGQIVGLYFDAQGREHGYLLSNGQYTTIDFPGAVATETLALDNKNNLTIAGDYVDASGVVHGFTLTAGVYKRFDVPNALGTAITGINDSKKIVGKYQSGANIRGFVGTLGTTTPLDFVYNPQFVTLPGGINNAGTVGGTYVEGGAASGFLFGSGVFVPGSIKEINDINDQGFVAGTTFFGGAPVAAFAFPIDPHSLAPPGLAGAIAMPVGALRAR